MAVPYALTNLAVWVCVGLIVLHIFKRVKRDPPAIPKVAKMVTYGLATLVCSGGAAASALIAKVHEIHSMVII